MEEERERRRKKRTVNIGPSVWLFRSPLLLRRKESSVLNVRHMEQQIFLAKLSQSLFPWQPLALRKGTKHKEILYVNSGHLFEMVWVTLRVKREGVCSNTGGGGGGAERHELFMHHLIWESNV